MLKLSLDALQILDAIDRRGSFAGAGKELHRVPSTISYTVAKLEEDLGVQVFERLGPKVALTRAGQELLKEGRYLLKAALDLELRVRRVASGWETEFAIGLESLFAPIVLAEDVSDFYQVAGSSTRLRIALDALSGTWEALIDRRVDLLIGAADDGPSGGGYVTEALGRVDFIFAVAPSHPLADIDRPLNKSDLRAHRAIAVSDSARRMLARTVGLLYGQETLTVPDMRSKLSYQVAGMGFGFLPEQFARPSIEAGLLVEKIVEEPKPHAVLNLAWRTGEDGEALNWWLERMRRPDVWQRLFAP